MFFYLYAIIELLAIFLDSGIIPTANVSYPVRHLPLAYSQPTLIRKCVLPSGLPRFTQALLLAHIPAFSSMALSASNLQRMAHLSHSGSVTMSSSLAKCLS